jgi:hypothetical protein
MCVLGPEKYGPGGRASVDQRAFHSCIINIRRAHSKCISRGRHKADRRIFRCVLKCTRRFIALGASFIRRLFPWRAALGRLVVDITPGSVMIMTWARRDTRPRGLGKAVAADSKFSAIRPAPFRLRGAATPRNASIGASAGPQTQMVFSRHQNAAARQIFMFNAIWPRQMESDICRALRQKIAGLANVMAQIKSNFFRMKNSMLHVAQWNLTT